MRHVAFQPETQRSQCLALLRLRDFHPNKRDHALRIQFIGARCVRDGTRDDHLRGFATRMVHNHPNGEL